jgi:transcriptional antiterminator NusG
MSEIEQEDREETLQQPEEDAASVADEAEMSPAEAGGVDEADMQASGSSEEVMPEEQEPDASEADEAGDATPGEVPGEADSAEQPETTGEVVQGGEGLDEEASAGEELATETAEAEQVVEAQADARETEDVEAEGAEDPEADVPVREPDDGRMWYVVHCYSGYENKVRHNLEQRIETMGMKDRIFDVVVPTEEEIEIKDGKRRNVERRVFPGYILVQMLMDEDSWYVVRNTPGVTGFVGMGNEPTPLRPEEVSQIIKRMEAEAPRIKVTYKIGQKVRIIDGPFNDFIGTVSDIDMDRAKVRVMVSFFGRETPVELDFLQVEKA